MGDSGCDHVAARVDERSILVILKHLSSSFVAEWELWRR